MPEVSVFDAYRVSRALKDQLPPDDRIEVVASDDITGDYWVLTTHELIIMRGDDVSTRLPLAEGAVSVRRVGTGVEVRVRDTAGGRALLIASFRRENKLTRQIVEMIRADVEDGPAE